MGTRADLYIGKGKDAEWIGSTAWDGYRDGIELTAPEKEPIAAGMHEPILVRKHKKFCKGKHLFDSKTEAEFRERALQYFANRDDATLPEMGWPWPWNDSGTSDCSYWFFDGRVWDVHYRGPGLRNPVWVPCDEALPDGADDQEGLFGHCESVVFPDMRSHKKTKHATLGPRSGLLVINVGKRT